MDVRHRRKLPQHVAAALDELKTALTKLYGRRLRGVYLYGSYARGEFRPESDVDVLVVLAGQVKPGPEITRMSPLVSRICLERDLLISILPVSGGMLERRPDWFFDQVRHEAVTV